MHSTDSRHRNFSLCDRVAGAVALDGGEDLPFLRVVIADEPDRQQHDVERDDMGDDTAKEVRTQIVEGQRIFLISTRSGEGASKRNRTRVR